MSTDPAVEAAASLARETFRYFWRELMWEHRRIVPALDMSAVKFGFSDPGEPALEYMWVTDVMFDGKVITGTLLNEPHELKTFREGQKIERPLADLYDWIYASMGKAWGAISVQQLRKQMSVDERVAHDDAWGLDFGEPGNLSIPGDPDEPDADHPMDVNMAVRLIADIAKGEIKPNEVIADGWTLLQSLSLGGAKACVQVLLDSGADPARKAPNGLTPYDLAKSLRWSSLAELLGRKSDS